MIEKGKLNTIDYSVVTYIFGDYEKIHPIKEKSDRCEYILVTDDAKLYKDRNRWGGWEVVYADEIEHIADPFRKVLYVRSNIFSYVHTNVVVRIDASIGINKSLDDIVDYFNKGEYDICLQHHPTRDNIYEEMVAWVNQRGLPIPEAERALNIMAQSGYDVQNWKSLFQYEFMIQRRNKINMDINNLTWSFNELMGTEDHTFRVDQITGSYVINKFFPDVKIMCVAQDIVMGKHMTWFAHNSDTPLKGTASSIPMFRNKSLDVAFLDY